MSINSDPKPSNPKDVVGSTKVAMSYVPCTVLLETAVGMMEGGLKYGRHNYRTVGVRASIYYDAAMRHMMAWWEGEDLDPASGVSHVSKAIASLVVLRDSMIRGNWVDDRPPKCSPGWLDELNGIAAEVIARFPAPAVPHTETTTVSGWQPIETAPKDGTDVVVCFRYDDGDEIAIAKSAGPKDFRWVLSDGALVQTSVAYKWMPLPESPK